MTAETIRIIEELRKISDSEWEELKANLLEGNNVTIEQKVYKLLKELEIPVNMKGYRYIKKAIILSVDNPKMLHSITQLLYPAVAEEFDTSWDAVERVIRHAIEKSCNKDKMCKICGNTYSLGKRKLTNSAFIASCVEYILNS